MHDDRCRAAYFDPALRAWVVSRYADVAAALRHPALRVPGEGTGAAASRAAPQAAAAREPIADRLVARRADLEASARERLRDLPVGRRVDLVREFAAPWSSELALQATGAPASGTDELVRLSRQVFLAAAYATDPRVAPEAQAAASELARRLAGCAPPLGVQAFVALSQTLPCLLAAAWRELFRCPGVAALLRADPDRLPGAVEELLRLAGPARAVFRQAGGEVHIGGAAIGDGEKVVLLVAAANRDPAQFPDPDRLELGRPPGAHLALGAGRHACVGAGLVRDATLAATGALLRGTDAVELDGHPEWIDGFAIRAPVSLPAVLGRVPHDRPLEPRDP